VGKNDDQDPNQSVVAIGLLGCALDNHSDPEDGARHDKNKKQESKDHVGSNLKTAHDWPINAVSIIPPNDK
jgi:hypothetical protein